MSNGTAESLMVSKLKGVLQVNIGRTDLQQKRLRGNLWQQPRDNEQLFFANSQKAHKLLFPNTSQVENSSHINKSVNNNHQGSLPYTQNQLL